MPHHKTSGAIIYYEQTGAGPDIVWIPGGDQRGREMRWQVEGFPDFRNTTHDPRGVGETGIVDEPPWTILDMARDCAELIEAVCEPPVVVAGLSMGSMITQEVAINWPHLVKVAIPMGTEAYASGFSREWMESEIRYRREHGNLPPDFAMTHYGAFMYPSEVLGDEELWNKLKQVTSDAYEHRDGAMLDAQWQACCDFDTRDRLPGCKVPIHVIGFSQDMQAPPQLGREVAELAGDGHFHMLEGLGHLSLCGHKPEVVNAKIREIVAQYA
jgi:pimeloyl-ACP methyl ester carboxylesterase